MLSCLCVCQTFKHLRFYHALNIESKILQWFKIFKPEICELNHLQRLLWKQDIHGLSSHRLIHPNTFLKQYKLQENISPLLQLVNWIPIHPCLSSFWFCCSNPLIVCHIFLVTTATIKSCFCLHLSLVTTSWTES